MMPEEDLAAVRRLLEEIRDAIKEHSRAIHTAEEGKGQKEPASQKVEAVISYNNQTVRETKAENERQYRTQKSIKHAAWAAFIAASIYALIAAFQLNEMHYTSQIDQRDWVGITEKNVSRVMIGNEIAVDIPVRNDGKTPALSLQTHGRI